MREKFVAYYRPTEEEFAELWEKCLFVVDANVLLDLYRYPQQVRHDFFKVFEQLSDRLWIPHQVGLEYQENRLSVIADQENKFKEVREIVEKSVQELTGKLEKLQLKKRHSTIDPSDLLSKIEKEVSTFMVQLDGLRRTQPDLISADTVRNRIDELLKGKVGEPFTQEKLNEICKDGELRKKWKVPPGYLDSGKAKNERPYYSWNGTIIPLEHGDLTLWHQIMEHAKDAKITHLIFVTGDLKEDWWWKTGSKIIGPRPELVNEIISKGGVSCFYMYSSPSFLKYAQQYLKVDIDPESIEQVRDIEDLLRKRSVSIRDDYIEALENVRGDRGRDQCIHEAIQYFSGLALEERRREASAQRVRIAHPASVEPDYYMWPDLVSVSDDLVEKLQKSDAYIDLTKTVNAALRLWLERKEGTTGLKP